MTAPSASWRFLEASSDGGEAGIFREIANETPIALEYNGMGYSVLMSTPKDLADLVYGFSLSERLIDEPGDILDLSEFTTDHGILIRVALSARCGERVYHRVRHRASDSSCGICGLENLEQALRPLPQIGEVSQVATASIFRAQKALGDFQALNARTGAVHAAAFCNADGEIQRVREDVGRHNAFDKLLGAMARERLSWDGGFALLSSRCSYELVEKAALAGCPLLATISAPTGLAVRAASQAGLRLAVLARADSVLLSKPEEGPTRDSPMLELHDRPNLI